MSLSIVVAAAENGAIGLDNTLPWRQSNDLKRFKALTLNHVVIMGRKTYESIGKPLPNRTTIVVTRNQSWDAGVDDVIVAFSLDHAIEIASKITTEKQLDSIMLVGGAQLYSLGMALADTIFLTRVHTQIEGDAFFPKISAAQWREISCEKHIRDEKNQYDYSFITLKKVKG